MSEYFCCCSSLLLLFFVVALLCRRNNRESAQTVPALENIRSQQELDRAITALDAQYRMAVGRLRE